MSRRRHTDQEKAAIIQEFECHQGRTADFCRQHGISAQTFTNWRRRADAALAASKEGPPKFVEFELGPTHDRQPASAPLVELELGGGMVLRILPARL